MGFTDHILGQNLWKISKKSGKILYFLLQRVVSSGKIWPNQSAFTCSKLTTETLKQGMKYVQN